MNAELQFPEQVTAKIGSAVHLQLVECERRFGVKRGALVRMALESFLPGYLAGGGRGEHTALLAEIAAAIEKQPALRADLEEFLRARFRAAPAA